MPSLYNMQTNQQTPSKILLRQVNQQVLQMDQLNKVCKPLSKGDTKLTKISAMNLVLLTKLDFSIIARPHTLIVKSFVAIYEREKGWWIQKEELKVTKNNIA